MFKKIYFAFILDEKLKLESLWKEYFDKIDINLYKLTQHSHKNYIGSLEMNELTIVHSSWRSTLLVHLAHFKAFLNSDCSHLLFVSESCIPIKSFMDFYNFVEIDKSHFTGYQVDYHPNTYRRNEYKDYLNKFHRMTIGEQWKLLCRKHIEHLVKNEKLLIEYFNNRFGDNEHYQTILHNSFRKEIFNYPLFYIRWKSGAHPVTFDEIDKNILDSNSFFCRKINEKTNVNKLKGVYEA